MIKSESFWPAIGVTILVLGVIFVPRISDIGLLLWCGDLNEIGDFLAGVFTPVAFGWLVYGYILQYKEFRLQRKELEQAREALGSQAKIMEERAEAERQRSIPYLHLVEEGDPNREPRLFRLRNSGGHAYDVELDLDGIVKRTGLLSGDSYGFQHRHSNRGPETLSLTVRFASAHTQKFYQHWRISFIGPHTPAAIDPTTGPTLLEAD